MPSVSSKASVSLELRHHVEANDLFEFHVLNGINSFPLGCLIAVGSYG